MEWLPVWILVTFVLVIKFSMNKKLGNKPQTSRTSKIMYLILWNLTCLITYISLRWKMIWCKMCCKCTVQLKNIAKIQKNIRKWLKKVKENIAVNVRWSKFGRSSQVNFVEKYLMVLYLHLCLWYRLIQRGRRKF